jgi:hypothetical protein
VATLASYKGIGRGDTVTLGYRRRPKNQHLRCGDWHKLRRFNCLTTKLRRECVEWDGVKPQKKGKVASSGMKAPPRIQPNPNNVFIILQSRASITLSGIEAPNNSIYSWSVCEASSDWNQKQRQRQRQRCSLVDERLFCVCEFAQFVPDHVLCDQQRNIVFPIVNLKSDPVRRCQCKVRKERWR